MRSTPALLLAVLFNCPSAWADVIYRIDIENPIYEVAVGAQQEIKVFFREITDGEIGKLAAGGSDGLFSAGFTLDYSGVTPALAAGARFVDYQANSTLFSAPDTVVTDDDVARVVRIGQLALDTFSGIEVPVDTGSGQSVYEIELGVLKFQNDGPLGTDTLLDMRNRDSIVNVFADFSVPTIPESHHGDSLITTAVPEPSSVVCLGLFLAIASRRRRVAKAAILRSRPNPGLITS